MKLCDLPDYQLRALVNEAQDWAVYLLAIQELERRGYEFPIPPVCYSA